MMGVGILVCILLSTTLIGIVSTEIYLDGKARRI